MKDSVKISLIFLICIWNFSSAELYAGKEEVQKQIDALNQKVKEAGEKGDLQAAITAAEEALELAGEGFGEKSRQAAKAMNNVANLYMYADHAVDAESLYKQAILIELEEYGAESTEAADSYFNLAMAYAVQKKYDEARKMLQKALTIRAEKLGEDHPDTQKVREALKEIWSDTTTVLPERIQR